MAIHVKLRHTTSYTYDRPVTLSPQVVRLRPAPHSRTPVLSYSLDISPKTHFINWQQDPQGNWLARLVFPEKVDHFTVDVDLVADMSIVNPFDFFLEPEAEHFPFTYDHALDHELKPFLLCDDASPLLKDYVASIDISKPIQTNDFIVALNQRLQSEISYTIRMEPGVQTPEQTLGMKSGSCRDSAWLLVQILRRLGLAARFVSGYLIQLVPDVKPLEGPAGAAEDFTDLHAWTEVYLPGAGWIGLDPTSGLLTGEGHIPLAASPDPSSAAPITGAVEMCTVGFEHKMSVVRVLETPRVTKPYSEEQWQAVLKLGDLVDEHLAKGDVRLTQGGEPTFISVEDMDAEEWNTSAVGPTKRAYADDLIRRLRDKFAPGALIAYGQGKWYPGESLPRWAFSLIWREDDEPVWRNPDLIALEKDDHQPTHELAHDFAKALTRHLGVDSAYAMPAWEDPAYYLLREQALPINVDPIESKLENPEERARLAAVFRRGLGTPTGYVLPLQPWQARDTFRWITGPWPTRDGKLITIPGDSPLGFRLPLESLPWIHPDDYPYHNERDPFEPRAPLPPPKRRQHSQIERVPASAAARGAVTQQVPVDLRPVETANGLVSENVRTALCVQPRDGRINVFLPPVETAEQYLDLIEAVELAAAEVKAPVHVEGYSPPADPRLKIIRVTPDPGVIEVNVHPVEHWRELVANTETLYEEAHQTRLGTEKFMVDGRHVGTGGGNHMVLGGWTPDDSPFLRRPDLLGSLIRFWQNHPSLSYLFSGLFIGPTSQHPRVDEARDDTLYELEIALTQLPPPGTNVAPWVVDRVLRNVLIDASGNTHRTELCIDKLYSPDGPTGRLGLVEFRAFEMPPHARMSLVQQLLLRALVARFWEDPYTEKLIRFGSSLRDRYMLPHWIERDFEQVLEWLRAGGYDFDKSWFAPHMEFRFPVVGGITHQGVRLELRNALEPWHVMGEEPGAGGTVRYVDSSVERIQVKVSNLEGDRYVVSCNGRRIPLAPTGVRGEAVAGVRYRAWAPASCLHPTIGVHTPLVFDLLDTWTGEAVAGCTYHVAHPGGRSYDTFPVNSYEAEARRRARFFPFGHSHGPLRVDGGAVHPDYPNTLDLRLQ
ncbi:IMP dehydrogenase [Paramagnetospirillum kuznetsovii]|uniref:IMP dehydrogenase n=1 Tax=Paramagnetospirillum kuznetsovii TaxID=2053833 RepID=A0A364NSX6_9PROT|nr:transglutaminase family protein [Paramagnetospirillum kuznetsovii]RAU20120.1 IMP dehydrogenase [Paramagnetospirillum kuznetsovii]